MKNATRIMSPVVVDDDEILTADFRAKAKKSNQKNSLRLVKGQGARNGVTA